MSVLLLFPPHCLPYQPWSTLPSLTAFLRANDVAVTQRDLNIEIYHRFLCPEFLRDIGARLEQLLAALESKASLSPPEQAQLLRTFRAYALSREAPDRIEAAKRTLTSPSEFYDFSALREAREIVSQAFQTISAAFHPAHLTHENFFVDDAHASLRGLLEVTRDPAVSPFIEIYEELLPSIGAANPPIIGISISLQEQVLPGLTLSRMLKQLLPDTKVVLGGFTLSKVAERIASQPEFFDVFADHLVVGEGEKPLLGLIRAVQSGAEPDSVPGVLFRQRGQVKAVGPAVCLQGKEQLTPDYDGLPLDLYLSPEPMLAVPASRGCYWGRCGFCDRGRANGITYRPRTPAAVAAGLELLSKRHGVRHFTFTDDAIAPPLLGRIAAEIASRGLDIRLSADCRFDPGFTPELCRKISDAGFIHLRFGLESASERVLRHMGKGTRRENIESALRNLSRQGICTHLYVFFGFPTESAAEADETIRFVTKNVNSVACACCTTFGLLEHAPVFLNPEKFGIQAVDRSPDRLFKYFFDWQGAAGPSAAAVANQKAAEFFAAMEREYEDFAVLGHLEWGHQFLYCSRYGFKPAALRRPAAAGFQESRPRQTNDAAFVPMLEPGTLCRESRYDLAAMAERLDGDPGDVAPKPTWILFGPRDSRLVQLNQHAAEILALIDSRTSVGAIAAALSERYSQPAHDMERTVGNFVEDLRRNELLRNGPAGKPSPMRTAPTERPSIEEASCR